MTDIINIPLNRLTAWKGNVRKTQSKAGIDELAASIKAHGLQQNLVVRKDGKTFAGVAGGRRLKALQRLAKAGDIEAAYEVPCRITKAEDAGEISLAENVIREDMHPADQFLAFRGLADKGMPATDIAARFGKSELHVLRLLKLARVSPKVLKAYRAGNLTLEDVMAFTVTDDHEAQDRVFRARAPWQGASEIRAALTENDIAATDKRVKFMTLKAYEKAGGAIKRDLFTDDDSGVYIEGTALLDTQVTGDNEPRESPCFHQEAVYSRASPGGLDAQTVVGFLARSIVTSETTTFVMGTTGIFVPTLTRRCPRPNQERRFVTAYEINFNTLVKSEKIVAGESSSLRFRSSLNFLIQITQC